MAGSVAMGEARMPVGWWLVGDFVRGYERVGRVGYRLRLTPGGCS